MTDGLSVTPAVNPSGVGPGFDRKTLNTVAHGAEQLRATGRARHGDARVEHDLLRRTRLSLRFGKLNHCALDETNPVGAKCQARQTP